MVQAGTLRVTEEDRKKAKAEDFQFFSSLYF